MCASCALTGQCECTDTSQPSLLAYEMLQSGQLLLLINLETSPVYEAFTIVIKVHVCAYFYRTGLINSIKTSDAFVSIEWDVTYPRVSILFMHVIHVNML